VTTPLFPTFKKRVDDAIEKLIEKQVTPWAFLTAGPPFRISYLDGKPIAYQGIGFEGSPRDIYWGRYIEPFLEALCVLEIGAAVSMAKDRQVDGRLLLLELQGLLSVGFAKVYRRMAEIDQRLLGKGYPERIALRPTVRELETMNQFLNSLIRGELEMWRPKEQAMMTYRGFIDELRFLLKQMVELRNSREMDKHPAFRKWRHALESIVEEVKRDYELPGEMRSTSRNFAGYGGGDFGPPPAFASYQLAMDDTANELEHIIASYEKRGEPKKKAKSESMTELKPPAKVTIAWLLDFVPVSIWAGAAAVVATSFALGFAAAKMNFFMKLAELLFGPQ
jgi:hypothetical protein